MINDGNSKTLVPYEVILFNNGIICKKSPHPVVASHILLCQTHRTGLSHDDWPIGFNFITFHYINGDHELRVDFVETSNLFGQGNQWTYEACSDLEIGDGECPRFRDKNEAFIHCMNLMKKEFNLNQIDDNNTNFCLKKLNFNCQN